MFKAIFNDVIHAFIFQSSFRGFLLKDEYVARLYSPASTNFQSSFRGFLLKVPAATRLYIHYVDLLSILF